MTAMLFVDTNVFVYSLDDGEPVKQHVARSMLGDPRHRVVVSPQVLGEFFVTLLRRFPEQFTKERAAEIIEPLIERCAVTIDGQLVRRAFHTSERHQLSYWDALIIESAREAGCKRLATEDLANGSVIRDVEIWNPFADVA